MKKSTSVFRLTPAEIARLPKPLAADLESVYDDPLSHDKYERREYIRSYIVCNLMIGKDITTAYYHARAEDLKERRKDFGYSMDEELEGGGKRSDTFAAVVQEPTDIRHAVTFSSAAEAVLDSLGSVVGAAGAAAGVGVGLSHRRELQIAKKNLSKLIEIERASRGLKGQTGFFVIGSELDSSLIKNEDLGEKEIGKVVVLKKKQAAKKTNIAKLHAKNEADEKGWNDGLAGQGWFGFGGAV